MIRWFRNKFYLCILSRLALAFLAAYFPSELLAYFMLFISFAFAALWIGIVRRDYGVEANGLVWWKPLRIFHSASYYVAGISLLLAQQDRVMARFAAYALLADVVVGFLAQQVHRLP